MDIPPKVAKRFILIIGYLDKSPKNIGLDAQRDIVNQYAQSEGFSVDVFFSDSDIKNIKSNLNTKENTIIIANITSIGHKISQIADNIENLISENFRLISAKENLSFDNSKQTKVLLKGVRLSIDIRNSMVSIITTNALKRRKQEGKVLGFPAGRKKKSLLEQHKYKIMQMLSQGKTKNEIAINIGCSRGLIFKYLHDHPELKTKMREI